MILMYHRIATPELDPWQLCVSADNFVQHLERLGRKYEFTRLSEVVGCHDPETKAVITFDDGYLDNLLAAKPILEKYSVPATVFVTTGYIGKDSEFWWDELEQLFLQPGKLPRKIKFDIAGVQCCFKFDKHQNYPADLATGLLNWKVTYDGADLPTERHSLFLHLWEKLQKAPETSRRLVLDYLFAWAGRKRVVRYTHRTMAPHELRALTDGGLIDVGSHCVTHGNLTAMRTDEKFVELNSSKEHLESILDKDILSLAYPHGEFDQQICEMTRSAGYECAVGTNRYRVEGFDIRFQLRRKAVLNMSGDAFQASVIEKNF